MNKRMHAYIERQQQQQQQQKNLQLGNGWIGKTTQHAGTIFIFFYSDFFFFWWWWGW